MGSIMECSDSSICVIFHISKDNKSTSLTKNITCKRRDFQQNTWTLKHFNGSYLVKKGWQLKINKRKICYSKQSEKKIIWLLNFKFNWFSILRFKSYIIFIQYDKCMIRQAIICIFAPQHESCWITHLVALSHYFCLTKESELNIILQRSG